MDGNARLFRCLPLTSRALNTSIAAQFEENKMLSILPSPLAEEGGVDEVRAG
jgi:hypothetical protein